MSKPKPLAAKPERFAHEYLIDGNAAAAYRRAGYKPKNDATAQACASRLLRNAKVAAIVAAGRKHLAAKADLTAEQVLREQMAIAFSDPGEVFDFTGRTLKLRTPADIPEHARRSISSVKVRTSGTGKKAKQSVEIRFWPKGNALEMLGRRFNLFPSRTEHTGKNGKAIEVSAKMEVDVARLKKLTDAQLSDLEAIMAAVAAPVVTDSGS